ncbi:MAG: TPM domain-containing protein [Candidatus Sumerlaeia bacterium]
MLLKRSISSFPSLRPGIAALVLVLVLFAWSAQIALAQIPNIPRDQRFTSDYAGLLDRDAFQAIANIQRTAYHQHQVPIIVVTIPSMAPYGGGPIEELATRWFNEWGIGKGAESGQNKGILLLISVGDRRARIELGADYGSAWDAHCQRIMDGFIISHFKQGNYKSGILAGVRALGEMAAMDIDAPPAASWESKLDEFQKGIASDEPLTPMTIVPRNLGFLFIAMSVILFICAFVFPKYRKILIQIAVLLITVSLALYVLLIVLAFLTRGSSRGGWFGSGGGFSSSGGFGGGFSGGGGASGSW